MNKTRIDIPLEKFVITVSPPANRFSVMFVHIYEDGRVNFNGKLTSEIHQDKVVLKFTEDYQYLCIQGGQDHPEPIRLPKSGSLKIKEVSEVLKKKNIVLPARVCFQKDK